MTTLLHVEDDEFFMEAVRDAFVALGFRGTHLVAASVREAETVLREPDTAIDLVVSDMQLPDGTGLDVIKCIRKHPQRADVPIIVLSADTDALRVNQAYAVGANAYVAKGIRGRSALRMISGLYEHWLRDVQLPSPAPATRVQLYFAHSSMIRARKAEMYMNIAQQLGASHGRFWMDLALREGNFSNLSAFLARLADYEIPDAVMDEAEAAQRISASEVDALVHRRVRTPADAARYLDDVISNLRVEVMSRLYALLLPHAGLAVRALQEAAGAALDQVASWIEANESDSALRDRIPQLRADAARMRGRPTRVVAEARSEH
jgi:CheY-like chemotaxis protein